MADPRTFVLIGDFQDNITPALERINNSIGGFKRTMASLSTKRGGGYNDITQAVGKLVSAQKHLKEAIEGVGAAAKSATNELKEYKNVMGKVASAHHHLQKSGTGAGKAQTQFWKGANSELDDYRKNLESLARKTRISPANYLGSGRRRGGGGGGGMGTPSLGGGNGPRPPRGGGGGGSRHGMGDSLGEYMGTFAFGMELGQGLAQPISSAIFSGFQMGVGLMSKTMEYVQSSFAERVQDQMTDLQAAGGFYSISQRQKNPMFASLQTAIQFTQENNLLMSRMASDLPGATKDYVEVSKRLGDSIMRMADANEKGAIDYARELMSKGGLQETYKGVKLEGPGSREGAIQVILGELTKKTVLAGFGGSTGKGGATGAYGLPAQMEKLITNPDTSLAQLQKYAAVFGDPKIMNALERAMPELEKAGGNMLERAKIVNKMLDEIVPPEMIAAMRKSMAGIGEAYRSAFFDPETGLFGFGRKIGEATEPMTNAFGQFVRIVNKNGKKIEEIVASADLADKVQLSVFEMFADILSNYGSILKPIVDNLYLLWDPMIGLKDVLADARIISTQILGAFREYNEALTEYANTITDEGARNKYLSTRTLRASLLTINEIFNDLGIIGDTDFQAVAKQVTDPKAGIKDLGNILSSTLDTFFKSDAAYNVGKFVGEMLRAVVDSLSDMTGFFASLGKTKLASGFMAGFGGDGVQKLQKLFTDIYKLLFDAAAAIIPMIPWQVYAAAAAGLVIPAAVAALGMAIGGGLAQLLGRMGENALEYMSKLGKKKVLPGKGGFPLTGSGVGITRSGGTSKAGQVPGKGGAKVTQGRGGMNFFQKSGARLRGLVKPGLGVGGEVESLLGGKLIKGGKQAMAAPKAFAKGIPVKIVSFAKNATAAVKGGGLGAGIGNVFKTGAAGLGKIGGVATIGVGVIEALMALFSGDSLGAALGKGAGPVLGTIIGTALLGPIGGILGGMIGSMESITEPLGAAFESIISTVTTTFDFLGQIGGDLLGVVNGFVRMIPGVSKEFDTLRFVITALLSPFRLLELMIIGLYEGYLRIKEKFFGLNDEEKAKKNELFQQRMQKTASLELDFKQAYNKKAREEYQKELDSLKAKGKGGEERARIVESALKIIDAKLKEKDPKYRPNSTTPATPKPGGGNAPLTGPKVGYLTKDGVKGWLGTDGSWTPLATPKITTPSKPIGDGSTGVSKPVGGKPIVAKEVSQTAQNTGSLDKKATDQIKRTTEVKAGTDKTTQAVNTLAAKITPQTNLQTTVAAIYNLMASGQLAVRGSVGTAPGGVAPPGPPVAPPGTTKPGEWALGNPFGRAKGGLGDAIASEMRMKPPGSDLVIANSSETVIPAAGGYGMLDFVETLRAGFNAMIATYKEAQTKQDNTLKGINTTLVANQQQTNARLQKLETKFAAPSMPGGLGGAGAGGVDAFTPIAARMGLQLTSGYRPGDPGWHGANRARDFSNGTGPTPQMMQFAQYMASTYGSNLKELIYTPLGFSIKNGQQVAPYAQGAHYNHVHVAYGLGAGNPAFFGSQSAAERWERSMVSGSVKIGSVTGNSAEGFGGGSVGDIYVTVNAGSTNDPDQLAYMVAERIQTAVSDAVNANILV
jgi:hypothetical protein